LRKLHLLALGTQSYSFAASMADTAYAALNFEGFSVITFGVVAVIGLPIGAFLSSVIVAEVDLLKGRFKRPFLWLYLKVLYFTRPGQFDNLIFTEYHWCLRFINIKEDLCITK